MSVPPNNSEKDNHPKNNHSNGGSNGGSNETGNNKSNDIVSWFARNHVAANLLMIFIIVIGLISLTSIQRELQPDLNIEVIQITMA